jgi:hypothetical protein
VSAKDIRPFLPGAPTPTRPLGAVLPVLATPPATSPWSPRSMADAPAALSVTEIAELRAEARDRGRADGLAETAALRARLTALIGQLAAARDALFPPTAEVIAEIATCVVETWIGNTHRSAAFAPIVRGWLARLTEPATARVHPDDAAALAEAIGDAPIAIAADPALAPGALAIRGAALELVHDWPARLAELRTAIVAALTGVES